MPTFVLRSVIAAACAFPLLVSGLYRRSSSLSLTETVTQKSPSFEEFLATNSRVYANDAGTEEYESRKDLYNKRAAAVNAHNSRSERLFTATVGEHADFNHTEMSAMHGLATDSPDSDTGEHYRTLVSGDESHPMSLETLKTLPDRVNWAHLQTMKAVKSQGHCGSCWAASSLKAIEAGYEINSQKAVNMSIQHLVSCAPNPHHCGGKGGCHGATGTIAMDFVLHHGIVSDTDYPYLAQDASCPTRLAQSDSQSNSKKIANSIGMTSWIRLQPNSMEPIMRAVADVGPMVASLSASDGLDGLGIHGYDGGVFDACSQDTIVNHAMVLYGYGTTHGGHSYWLLQNSWGQNWGENGRMKMLRVDGRCGTDDKPSKGSGCDGGPTQIRVCGMCGIHYRAVVPVFASDSTEKRQSILHRSDLAASSDSSDPTVS